MKYNNFYVYNTSGQIVKTQKVIKNAIDNINTTYYSKFKFMCMLNNTQFYRI